MSQLILLAQASSGGGASMIVIFVAMFAIMYFMVIRPQQKQAKQHQTMLAALKKGDEVVTQGGMIGKIAAIADKEITLEVASGVKLRILKTSVQGRSAALDKTQAAAKVEEKEEKS